MANDKTAIEWTDSSWNPTTGCTHVSDGCKNCYAEALSLRFGHTKKPWIKPHEAENVKLHPERIEQPYRWKKPRRIFVDSMSDLFHPLVPDGFIAWVWLTMAHTPWHTYQILTKRPERMRAWVRRWNDLSGESCEPRMVRGPEATRATHPSGRGQLYAAYLDELGKTVPAGKPLPGAWPTFDWMEGPRWWPTRPLPNVWLGTSVEDQRAVDRVLWLVDTPAAVRFLSVEPMIGPVDLTRIPVVEPQPPNGPGVWLNALTGHYVGPDDVTDDRVHWVITGGESGPNHRPFDPAWAAAIRDQCRAVGVAYFHKQNGGRTPKAGGRLLDGREWNQMPEAAATGQAAMELVG